MRLRTLTHHNKISHWTVFIHSFARDMQAVYVTKILYIFHNSLTGQNVFYFWLCDLQWWGDTPAVTELYKAWRSALLELGRLCGDDTPRTVLVWYKSPIKTYVMLWTHTVIYILDSLQLYIVTYSQSLKDIVEVVYRLCCCQYSLHVKIMHDIL